MAIVQKMRTKYNSNCRNNCPFIDSFRLTPVHLFPEHGGGSRCLDERRAALRQFQTTSHSSSPSDAGQTSAATDHAAAADGRRPPSGSPLPGGFSLTSGSGGGASEVAESQPYVPECRPDGRYVDSQCHNATSYCWCVAPDTGKPLPGSSVHGRRPTDCAARLRRLHGT